MTKEENAKLYKEAAHAMQSGVAAKMNYDRSETDPKHLRVGINSALSTNGALGKLLIEKGVITEDEYLEAVRIAMEEEVSSYEKDLSELTGKKITLL